MEELQKNLYVLSSFPFLSAYTYYECKVFTIVFNLKINWNLKNK